MAYESYCWKCRVTHPPGTRRCIHCGGPVSDERPGAGTRILREGMRAEAAAQETDVDDAEERPEAPRGLRLGMTAVWILLAIAASLYRACSGGG